MQYQSFQQRCAFPPCTNSFPRLNSKKKYCSGCCRVKDFNRRKKRQEDILNITTDCKEEKTLQKISLPGAAPHALGQTEIPTEQKKGMTLAGVGEAALGTAGVLLMKDQLFNKDHRKQLQQQMNQLFQQQAIIYKQIQELNKKMDQLGKGKAHLCWWGSY